MKRLQHIILLVSLVFLFLLEGCTASSNAAKNEVVPTSVKTPPAEQAAATTKEAGILSIYAPASTSSIPVILAASKMKNVSLTLYTNQAQANTLFLRGDASILVTGLSVGVDMVRNGAPVQMVNSYVSGLSYLVAYNHSAAQFSDLKGQKIYLPFKGSPVEEVSAHLAQKSGLLWGQDLTPVYAPFDSSVELLKQGKADWVVLPEPNVSLLEGQPNIQISLSLYDEWNKAHPGEDGYPQVSSFVNANWAKEHAQTINDFNQALADAIVMTQQNPSAAVDAAKGQFKLPQAILLKSLSRTRYHMLTGAKMQDAINHYYLTIGKPLDEKFAAFYYLPL
jgi:NitT/TauT family transport system substrate-binding protein